MAKSGSTVRLITVLPIAAVVTAGIFFAMSGLIHTEAEPREATEPPVIEFAMKEREGPLEPEDLGPPDPVTPPPDPRPTEWEIDSSEPVFAVTPPDPAPGSKINPIVLPTLSDAILSPDPNYPSSCLSKGIEGYAVVEFDVTASGNVINARVFDSSHSCFNGAAIRAIQRWKFQPSTDGGNSVVRAGLRKKFVFRIAG